MPAVRRTLSLVLLVFTVAGWVYTGVSVWLLRRLLDQRQPGAARVADGGTGDAGTPKHATPDPPFTPPVSVLKPVRGLDHGAYATFAGLLSQDYPDYEVLWAVGDPHDEAIPVIEEVRRAHPQVPSRLIVSEWRRPNPKVAVLEELVAAAGNDVLLIADSDVRAGPDYVRRVVAPLEDPEVGLVTCLYRGSHAHNLAARLHALYMGEGFLPSAAVGGLVLRTRFALGATMVVRRQDLDRSGGLAALGSYLADDYQLGARIAATGLRVRLAPYVVEIPLGPMRFGEVWRSEVRWARCSRVSRPLEYPGLVFTLPVPLSLAWFLMRGRHHGDAWVLPVVSLLLRYATARRVTHQIGDTELRPWLALLPVRDLLTMCVLVAGALGRRVEWRGRWYRVGSDGRIVAVRRTPRSDRSDAASSS